MLRTIGMWPAVAAGLAACAIAPAASAQAGPGSGAWVVVPDGPESGPRGQGGEWNERGDRVMRRRGVPFSGAWVTGGGPEGGRGMRRAPQPAQGGGHWTFGPGGGEGRGGEHEVIIQLDDGDGPRGGEGKGGGCACCAGCCGGEGRAEKREQRFELKVPGPEGVWLRAPAPKAKRGGPGADRFENTERRAEVRGKVVIVGPDGQKQEFDLPADGMGEWRQAPRPPRPPAPPRAPRAPRGMGGGEGPGHGEWREGRMFIGPDGGAMRGFRFRDGGRASSGEGTEDDREVIIELDGPQGGFEIEEFGGPEGEDGDVLFLEGFGEWVEPAAETLPPPAPRRAVSGPI